MKIPKKRKPLPLIKKAWKVFSLYIRTKYAVDGIVTCVTCGVQMPIKRIQAGHYERRSKKNLLFDERNVHPQCMICNVFGDGRPQEYALYLRRQYGPDILEELKADSLILKKWRKTELEEIVEKYKIKE